jgi:hypothetical protein
MFGAWGTVDVGQWSVSRSYRFTLEKRVVGSLWTGKWVGPRVCLGVTEKRKTIAPDGNLTPSLYRLSYPGSCRCMHEYNGRSNMNCVTSERIVKVLGVVWILIFHQHRMKVIKKHSRYCCNDWSNRFSTCKEKHTQPSGILSSECKSRSGSPHPCVVCAVCCTMFWHYRLSCHVEIISPVRGGKFLCAHYLLQSRLLTKYRPQVT